MKEKPSKKSGLDMEAERHSVHFLAAYGRAEIAEDAWNRCQLALSRPERDALDDDYATFNALSRLFSSARAPEELEQFASMTVDELARLAADIDAAALAKLDAAGRLQRRIQGRDRRQDTLRPKAGQRTIIMDPSTGRVKPDA